MKYYNDLLFPKFLIKFTEMLFSSVTKRRSEYLSGRIAAQTLFSEEQIYDWLV
ncbi:hypothetical protein BN1221_03478c [Brenneria goodwinii]|uniref:Mobile element protein n=1 Tax=Brenneria goodwinii TaxID=1109412 RepID=A0A0G4JYE1_9GAMM|nr:hypothetical protein BN1221_03478c [Brenneria goodwinii]